jgi:uncharacterized repeat protein (TIGR01451 family)
LHAGDRAVVRGALNSPSNKKDTYSFDAQAGDYIYAATMTAIADDNVDSKLTLWRAPVPTAQGQNAAYVLEFDDNDGSFGPRSSSIAGARIPATGTYYLVVEATSPTLKTYHPYTLYFRLHRGAPLPGNPPALLPASGWVSGTLAAGSISTDGYLFNADAGDTVFLSLDLDPERNGVTTDGRLTVVPVDNGGDLRYLTADDSNPVTTALMSEALFVTVRKSGQYIAVVDSTTPPSAPQTYTLSFTKFPQPQPVGICTTYTSTDVPKTIGPDLSLVRSTITVPGNPRVADLDVDIHLNHAHMSDVDAHLRSPAGNSVGLFTDIGSAPGFSQTKFDVTFDDEAAIPPDLNWLQSIRYMPEREYRLNWFDGVNAGGTWTLDLRDDEVSNGGALTGWSLRICEPTPPPPPTCPPGLALQTAYSSDFEAGDGGFTHNGTADEWERGLPAYAPITTCNSGTGCWKTDLDNTYNPNSSQTLRSPPIDLGEFFPPVIVRWAQQYQLQDIGNDGYWAGAQEVGNPVGNMTLFQWQDRTIGDDLAGNPEERVPQAAGWSESSVLIDAFAGKRIELEFRLSSNEAAQFAGVAIDDVSVMACRALSTDLTITKTDGVSTVVPGQSVTYTIKASNTGLLNAPGAIVSDYFPIACASVSWTCVGSGGGTCSASGTGSFNDVVNLPAGGSVTYTATCAVSPTATGLLSNSASVIAPNGVTDSVPTNNTATDTDTLTPQYADLSITKTDGVTSVVPGQSVTYTIKASNSGPLHAPGAIVTDNFPIACASANWTCVGSGGGTCSASGTGSFSDEVNLPAGGSVTYTASCTVSPSATGTLSNSAFVTAPSGVPDTAQANNSATDTDTLTPITNIPKTDLIAGLGSTFTAPGSTVVLTSGNPIPGGTITYTLTAWNFGVTPLTGASVTNTFPAACTSVTWTCTATYGSSCTAAGSGNITDTVNLPARGIARYTAICAISPTATGTLSNTLTVTAPVGVVDTNPNNNRLTQTLTLLR